VEQLNLYDALGHISIRVEPRSQIVAMRAEGLGPSAIARRFNTAAVPTPAGLLGRWRPETVLRVEDPARWARYMREYRRRRD
jgi:hypothetical protein